MLSHSQFRVSDATKKDTQGKTVFKLALTQKPLHITYSNNEKASMGQVKIQNFFHSIFFNVCYFKNSGPTFKSPNLNVHSKWVLHMTLF